MDEIFDVWDNSLVNTHERSPEAFRKVMKAKQSTGATRVVVVRWSHCGKTHEARSCIGAAARSERDCRTV
jgi:hypothetical protein